MNKTPITTVKLNRRERGSEVVEFALVLLPLLAILFLILDIAWLVFAQGSLQWAVQQGVRYGITSNVASGKGQDASIKSIVQSNAMGFLNGSAGLSKISVSFYAPSNLSTAVTGSGSNVGGNVLKVSVTGVQVSSFGPIWRSGPSVISLSANSSDVMESSPGGVPPTR
jgi:Flp pilus assembly protein TadG